MTIFRQLNDGWNAEPNAPEPKVVVDENDIVITFLLNPFQFPQFSEEDRGRIRFTRCQRYRLGATNDEGWYRGQCRFSRLAPQWGEFYEIEGDLLLEKSPNDWIKLIQVQAPARHFLFYFRDQTFECDALDYKFDILKDTEAA